jgi:exodeoxyribonuclease-3
MRIAIWNVNSIKARLDHVKKWLETSETDVLMIQELKGLEFPKAEFENMGFKTEAVTQKAYNGVAIISKYDIETVITSLPDDKDDEQARYIEADINGIRLINIYLPNGNPIDTEKFDYKLSWMDRLKDRLSYLRDQNIAFAIGGDFNVIPEDRDCFDPQEWKNDALFHIKSRQKFRSLLNMGLTDAFRIHNNEDKQYSFWDYQGGAWPQGKGIRIDHFLLSPAIADRLISCTIDTEPRGWEKASDHTPVTMVIS